MSGVSSGQWRYVSIGCEPCMRTVLPGQHEREGRWWWEDAKAKECVLHKGNISSTQDESQKVVGVDGSLNSVNGTITDIFQSRDIVNLTRPGIENLMKMDRLYAPWCRFCQAMEGSYVELAEKLSESSGVKVGKFRADGDQKLFAQRELQLGSFPTILFFPKPASRPIKYASENRDVDALLAFINALR